VGVVQSGLKHTVLLVVPMSYKGKTLAARAEDQAESVGEKERASQVNASALLICGVHLSNNGNQLIKLHNGRHKHAVEWDYLLSPGMIRVMRHL